MMPVRWYHGTFALEGRRLRIPVARGCPPLRVRLDRDLPYPPGQVRSVTLLYDAGRLWADVTAEVPVTAYPPGRSRIRGRVAGVDLGIIRPYAVAGPDGQALLVSGRAIRAEHHLHLKTPKHGAGPWPAAPRNRGSAGPGAGGATGAASGSWRRGTPAGSARPSTKPPAP